MFFMCWFTHEHSQFCCYFFSSSIKKIKTFKKKKEKESLILVWSVCVCSKQELPSVYFNLPTPLILFSRLFEQIWNDGLIA